MKTLLTALLLGLSLTTAQAWEVAVDGDQVPQKYFGTWCPIGQPDPEAYNQAKHVTYKRCTDNDGLKISKDQTVEYHEDGCDLVAGEDKGHSYSAMWYCSGEGSHSSIVIKWHLEKDKLAQDIIAGPLSWEAIRNEQDVATPR